MCPAKNRISRKSPATGPRQTVRLRAAPRAKPATPAASSMETRARSRQRIASQASSSSTCSTCSSTCSSSSSSDDGGGSRSPAQRARSIAFRPDDGRPCFSQPMRRSALQGQQKTAYRCVLKPGKDPEALRLKRSVQADASRICRHDTPEDRVLRSTPLLARMADLEKKARTMSDSEFLQETFKMTRAINRAIRLLLIQRSVVLDSILQEFYLFKRNPTPAEVRKHHLYENGMLKDGAENSRIIAGMEQQQKEAEAAQIYRDNGQPLSPQDVAQFHAFEGDVIPDTSNPSDGPAPEIDNIVSVDFDSDVYDHFQLAPSLESMEDFLKGRDAISIGEDVMQDTMRSDDDVPNFMDSFMQ